MRKPHLNGHQKDLFSNVLTVDGPYFDQALDSESNTPWPPELSSGDRGTASDSQGDARSQDQTRAFNNRELYSSSQYICSLPSNSFPAQSTYNPLGWHILDENFGLQYPNSHDSWQPLDPITTPQEPRGEAEQPYDHRETSVPDATAPGRLGSLVMPVQTIESSVQEPSPCLSTLSPSAPAYPASTSSMGSPNKNHKVKMEAARMEDGLLHCAHADCVNKTQGFLRRCEYT